MKRAKLFIAALVVVLMGFGGLLAAPLASAATPKQVVCSTLGSDNACSKQPAGGVDINHVITVVISTLSKVVGVLAVIMVMYAGFRYITSGGDSNKVSSAKNTLIYAMVGLVIAFFAQAIVSFVLNKVNK